MLLDIGLSLLYAILISSVFDVSLELHIVIASIIFSLLPDIDTPIELLQRGKLGGKESGFHREVTHYPIIYIPLAAFIWIYFGAFWVTLFLINILSHFIHDSIWTGWGIKWLWPFTKNNYKFISNKQGDFTKKLFSSWTPAELKEMMSEHGDDDWFKKMYLRFSPVLIAELLVFLIGLVIALLVYADLF